MGLTTGSTGVLKGAITIAVRYGAGRQQFGPPDAAEVGSLGQGSCICSSSCGISGHELLQMRTWQLLGISVNMDRAYSYSNVSCMTTLNVISCTMPSRLQCWTTKVSSSS